MLSEADRAAFRERMRRELANIPGLSEARADEIARHRAAERRHVARERIRQDAAAEPADAGAVITPGELTALHRRVGELRRLARELDGYGYGAMAAELRTDADGIDGSEVTVRYQCLVHRGPFTIPWRIGEVPDGAFHDGAICGPCASGAPAAGGGPLLR